MEDIRLRCTNRYERTYCKLIFLMWMIANAKSDECRRKWPNREHLVWKLLALQLTSYGMDLKSSKLPACCLIMDSIEQVKKEYDFVEVKVRNNIKVNQFKCWWLRYDVKELWKIFFLVFSREFAITLGCLTLIWLNFIMGVQRIIKMETI